MDISQRKHEEEMLRQSEEKYRGLIENIKDGIFIIQDAKLKFVNEAFARIAGYSAQEIIGMDFRDLVDPEDRELVVDRYTRRLRGEKVPSEYEFRLIRKDRTIITVDMNVGAFSYFGRKASIGILKDVTQRKRMEEALHASEEKFSKAFYSSPQSISITTLNDGRIIEINDSFTNSLGFSREEAIGHTTVELGIWITPEDRIRFVDSFKKNGYVRNMELDLRAKKGNILSMLLSSELIDVAGKACILSTFYDITERKRAEKELEETIIKVQNEKNKSESIIAALGDAISIQDTDFKVLYQNKIHQEITGNQKGKYCYREYEHRDKICEGCPVDLTFKDGKIHNEERSIIKDGQRLYFDITSSPLRDSTGRIIAGIELARDITQRKLSEEKLRNSEQRFRKLVQTEPECVKLLTEDNTLIDMNPAGLGMIEADSLEQVAGKSIMGVIDSEYKEAFADVGRSVFKGESASLEFSITGLKGTKRWLETHAVPLRDDNGKINFLLAVTRDVTERRRTQEERIQLIEREQTALAQAEAALKLDRMKSMFIASTSHELRTPLNAIIGFSSLILAGLSGELNPEQKTQIGIVHSSAKHLLALISDVIDLSKIEAGKIDVNISQFDLREIVDEVVTTLDSSIKEKRLNVRVEVENIPMRTDRMRLFQCLLNIIGNAVKYTENGSIKVNAKKRDNNVDISVTDTGIGIKTEDIPRLFEPFVRLESLLTLKTSGTGLGLYLTKKLARDFLRGDIDVKSEPGKGSTFMLKIPVEIQ